MLINWFTVSAQIVNFLILMLLLKHFLYDRIIEAMDAREESIQERLEEADRKEKEAEERLRSLESEKKSFESKKKELFSKAEEEVRTSKEEWYEKARREVGNKRENWRRSLNEEKEALLESLRQSAFTRVFAVCGKLLSDLADETIEEKMAERFIARLKSMDAETRRSLAPGERSAKGVVRSRFDISGEMRRKITRAIHDAVAKELELVYETDSGLLAGIELKTAGKKIAWSQANYLKELETEAMEILAHYGREAEENNGKKEQTDGRERENDGSAGGQA